MFEELSGHEAMNNKGAVLMWGALGVSWGLVIAFASIFTAGAGHGWVSSLPFGILAILITPVATIAWALRKTHGKQLAIVAIVIAVILDVLLLWATFAEGVEFFFEVLPQAIVWLVLWGSWQLLALIVLLSRLRQRQQP